MVKSALLENLCDEYCKTQTDDNVKQTLAAFCQFAADRLKERSIVGVNYVLDGLALRFADGTDLSILSDDSNSFSAGIPVQVTGGAQKLNARLDTAVSPAFQITGR